MIIIRIIVGTRKPTVPSKKGIDYEKHHTDALACEARGLEISLRLGYNFFCKL